MISPCVSNICVSSFFRGVAEDTHFETQTRKEISKIQWYGVKDLPGFKKQAKHQQQSEAESHHATKFYMVAPFLGPLKKWINVQRKKDAVEAQRKVSASYDFASVNPQAGGEDESEDQQTLEHADVATGRKENDLKGSSNADTMHTYVSQPTKPDGHAGNLLAMLQGQPNSMNGGPPPHTPFDQINAFPSQPETPQPHHPRQPSIPQQQISPPPQFPFSPQAYQQRNFPLPTPNVFGPGFGPQGFPHNQTPGFAPGMLPPHLQAQHFQQRPQMPGPMPFQQQSFVPSNGLARPPIAPAQMPGPPPFQQVPPPTAFATRAPQAAIGSGPSVPNASQLPAPNLTRGPQAAIGSGPSVPNASQLPAPNLNPHTMRLLDAFRSGGAKPSPSIQTSNRAPSRPTSTHQAALLDLFKKPSTLTSTSEIAQSAPQAEPGSHAQSDVTEKSPRQSKVQSRRPTMNEITRTLPPRPKAKATPPPERGTAPQPSHERPRSRQLFDPDHPDKLVQTTNEARIDANGADQRSPVRILQRPSPKQPQQSPKTNQATISASPSLRDNTSKENWSRSSPFTILARPGSSKGQTHSATVGTASPRPNETPNTTFQPQVLKRPQSSDAERKDIVENGPDKKDQLLALFGKTPTVDRPPAVQEQQQRGVAERKESQPHGDERTALLGLFDTGNTRQQRAPSPAPPPAPIIQPSTQSTRTTAHNKQQNLLLDLFNKPSGTPTASPGTPISPFTLGTPAATQPPKRLPTNLSSTTASPTSSGGTLVEAKEFLMGYLNGVVKNEGYRGAGSKR